MKNNCNNTCEKCFSYAIPGAPCVTCEGTPCEQVYYSSCVTYTGNCLECYGIQSGDNITVIIDKLLELIYEQRECEDCLINGVIEFDCCLTGDISGYTNPTQCFTTTTTTLTTTTTTFPLLT